MKTALILSGGGAKGCFQVGAMKRLIEDGVKPDIIFGTSTGALQAAGYAHIGMYELEKVWLSIKAKSDVMGSNWMNLWRDGKHHMRPLKKKLELIEKSSGFRLCDAVVTRVCMETGEVEYIDFDHPEFLLSVLASACVPFVSTPIKIGDKHYVDGGVRDQVPVRELKRLVAEGYKVIVISTKPVMINPDPWKMPKIFPLWKIIVRVADDILPTETWLDELRQVKEMQLAGAPVELIIPQRAWMGTEEYDPEKIRLGIAMGYAAEPTNLKEVKL